MRVRHQVAIFICATLNTASVNPASAADQSIIVASTTSTQDSGLFGHILPLFKAKTGIDVKVVAQGTGQALDTARRGDADVVFVHAKAQEEQFVAEGFGVVRADVMYNDFVLIGPKSDPARIRGGKDILAAFTEIQNSGAPFVSRGDNSGTHAAELRYWKSAGIDDPAARPPGRSLDYRACGCGMGPALNIAASSDAYVLADRGSWLAFRNRGKLAPLVEGDTRLFNQYGVIVVNPARHPHTRTTAAQAFADWVVSPAGQAAIAGYRIGGALREQLFFPNAAR